MFDESNYDDLPQNSRQTGPSCQCPVRGFRDVRAATHAFSYLLSPWGRGRSTGLLLKSLRRNVSKEADHLLDWFVRGPQPPKRTDRTHNADTRSREG